MDVLSENRFQDPLAEEILHLFDRAVKRRDGYMVSCPLPQHADSTPSVSLKNGQDKSGNHILLVKCFNNECDSLDILKYIRGQNDLSTIPQDVLKSLAEGKTYVKKNPTKRNLKLVKVYDYRDVDGSLLYHSLRYIDTDGKKTFMYRRPASKEEYEESGLDWIWSVKDVKKVIYRLPDILDHFRRYPNRYVAIVEGEKDADNCLDWLGLQATCNPFGCSTPPENGKKEDFKWLPHFNDYFEGRNVMLIPDNDSPGYYHMFNVAENLRNVANSVKVVFLTDLKKQKEDISDWILTYKHTKSDFLELFNNAVEVKGLSDEELKELFTFKTPDILPIDEAGLEDVDFNELISTITDDEKQESGYEAFRTNITKLLDNEGFLTGLCEKCYGNDFLATFDQDDGTIVFLLEKGVDDEMSIKPCPHVFSLSSEQEEFISNEYDY